MQIMSILTNKREGERGKEREREKERERRDRESKLRGGKIRRKNRVSVEQAFTL